jgi:hypothetical protein
MKKKILLTLLALAVVGIGYFGYRMAMPQSPAGTASFKEQGLDVTVTYSRPYKKGRVIFGPGEDALQPYGQYWRLGANAATEISFGLPVLFADHPVMAGTYRMYAIPGESVWKVVLNSELGVEGSSEPDHDRDVLSVEVQPITTPFVTEQFTISFNPTENGADMEFNWDSVRITIPIQPE